MSEDPSPEDVRAQLERLLGTRHFRGIKLKQLLTFLVGEWLTDRGAQLTLSYIAETLKIEPLTFEEDSNKWGYPRTRANLGHVRNRLKKHHETEGYRDRVIIKLNAGSYAPVIAYNPISANTPDVDSKVARLILRAKTAIDMRSLKSARRALDYYLQIPLGTDNARQMANILFIPMAAAPIIPSAVFAIEPSVKEVLGRIKASGIEPWESIFTEACAEACYRHRWTKALELFELSISASQGEARYLWWYTALLASLGRVEEAMGLLEDAVTHFSRTNIATRTDLALLQIASGRFEDAEEHLAASLDFAPAGSPAIPCHYALLYEAQDRLIEATALLAKFMNYQDQSRLEGAGTDESRGGGDSSLYLNGLFALILGRAGAVSIAAEMTDILLSLKEKRPASSSVEIALCMIGLGRSEEAVSWLTRAAFEEYDPGAMWFHIFPPLRHLRASKPFRELLRRLDLPLPQIH